MNISNMHDLRIAKLECRHKIELQERLMQSYLSGLKIAAQESLKISLSYFAKELAINLVKNILKHGRRKKQ